MQGQCGINIIVGRRPGWLNHEHPVETRTNAPEHDLAEVDVEQRDHAAEWRIAVVHRVHGAVRSVGGGGRPD